jgi:hypothetical protein
MSPPGFETLCLTFTAPIVHCKEEAMWESWFNECSTETHQSSETQYKSKRTHVSLCFFCKINLFKCISKRKESRTKNEKKNPHLSMRNMKFSNIVMQVIFSRVKERQDQIGSFC